MYVVVGATGHTGSVVAQTLLGQNQPVRVVVRSADKGAQWRAKGAEVAVATYDDREAFARALQGARGVYLLIAPNYGAQPWLDAQRRSMDEVASVVRTGGNPHVVFLSSIGAHLPGRTGPIRAVRHGEEVLSAATSTFTGLRPAYFVENWGPVLGVAKTQGVLPTFIAPDMKIPMISTRDIGRIAAERLMAGGSGRETIELSGPEQYSPDDVAGALSVLLERPVSTQAAPLTSVVTTFKSFGFSDDAARLFEEMYRAFASGYIGYELPDRIVRGKLPLAEALKSLLPVT